MIISESFLHSAIICRSIIVHNHAVRASECFQDWWAEVTHGAKNGVSFSGMMGPSISNQPQLTFG